MLIDTHLHGQNRKAGSSEPICDIYNFHVRVEFVDKNVKMLRRSAKKAQDIEKAGLEREVKHKTNVCQPLGTKSNDGKAEKVLEELVLGGDEEIVKHLERPASKKVSYLPK